MHADRYRGRFAPSPTGPLHLGSLVAALGSWLLAREAGGDWLVRIEDIDPPREIPGMAKQQLCTLAAFGLEPDEPVLWQSQRGPAYSTALAGLLSTGDAFECACSRATLAADGGIHRQCQGSAIRQELAVRLRVADIRISFEDRFQGWFGQDLGRDVGDFVLRRTDGFWAYQLAVVVDDASQGINHVVRGADLLDSTPRQIYLQQKLALATPAYVHLPLVLGDDGHKLAKSSGSPEVDPDNPLPALRAAWAHLGQETGILEGYMPIPRALQRAVSAFDPGRVPHSRPAIAGQP